MVAPDFVPEVCHTCVTCKVQVAGDSTQIAGIPSFCQSDSTSRFWSCFWVTAVPPLETSNQWDSRKVIHPVLEAK